MKTRLDDHYFEMETPLDHPVRYLHEGCESSSKAYTDRALVVIRSTKGWGYRCHRCGISGFRPYKHLTPSQVAQLYDQRNNSTSGSALRERRDLPEDFTLEIPAKPLAWLLKCVSLEEIKEHGIGWSPSLERIIFPIYEGTTMVGYCGRSLRDGPGCPKYLTITFDPLRKERIFFGVQRDSPHVVIVEDILSALVVGRHVSTVALLGSFVPPELVGRYEGKKIWIWLDNNKLKESLSFRNRYSSMGYDVSSVLSYADPKFQTQKDIEGYLGLAA